MGIERINNYSNRAENQGSLKRDEVQNARQNFVVAEKVKKTESKTKGLWSDDASREQTFEELKTLVRAIQTGETEPFKLTDLIFYARHPELLGKSLANQPEMLDEWNSISALLVHPTLNEVGNILGANLQNAEIVGAGEVESAFERASQSKVKNLPISGVGTNLYDEVIARSVEWCPGLSPQILKSLLAQESNFRPAVINKYGYAGIAQFGRTAAREVGLSVGIAGSATDERLNPGKAIPGAARLLNIKAKRLGEIAFAKYGQPTGTNFWKFVLAAYNGGEATVSLAMGNAYRIGVSKARAQGLVGEDVVRFARNYASNWENLKSGGTGSPLGQAAARFFPAIAAQKYVEIGNYPTQIVGRVKA
ncbi:MAG TPA: transglycosylase SLT domain-containing protein [Pyrinomonadaceae bacterium]|jgi:soluble lytic murein transglycosylase-like protein